MSRKPWGSEHHRFAIEELLDHPVIGSPNSQTAPAAGKARRSVPKPNKEKTTAIKPRKRIAAGRTERKVNSHV
jgi:hypothetical protein